MREILLSLLFILFSCGQDLPSKSSSRATASSNLSGVSCSCSDANSPVCGNAGDQYITFLNACIAQCSNYDYVDGICPEELNPRCNQASGLVCGQPPMPTCPSNMACATVMPAPVVYSNHCELISAGATMIEMSNCSSN